MHSNSKCKWLRPGATFFFVLAYQNTYVLFNLETRRIYFVIITIRQESRYSSFCSLLNRGSRVFTGQACRALGVAEHSLFETVDLYEIKDLGLVVRCLFALGSAVQLTVR